MSDLLQRLKDRKLVQWTLAGFPGFGAFFPGLDPLHCERRFVAMLDRLKTKGPHAEKVCGRKG